MSYAVESVNWGDIVAMIKRIPVVQQEAVCLTKFGPESGECVNAATCLLAVRSGLSPGRKSDLQMHRTLSAFGDHRALFVSGIGQTVS